MKRIHNLKQFLLLLAFTLSALSTLPAQGDDTDLYIVNPNVSTDRPNVLIFVDNTSNWSTYFSNEMTALKTVIAGLSSQFNVGIMMFTKANESDGAYVRAAIRQMTSTNQALYAGMFDTTQANAIGVNTDKSNSTTPYGYAMTEVWKYFTAGSATAGTTASARDYPGNATGDFPAAGSPTIHGLAGNAFASSSATTYSNSFLTGLCQKNFLIFISNGHPSTAEKNDSFPATQLVAAGGNTNPSTLTSGSLSWNTMPYWARFMATNTTGSAKVFTYSVAIAPDTWPNGTKDDTITLLKSTASQGKGKYYGITGGNTADIVTALNTIFQEILAINSVFASVTLPVNVNIRGQYLNQIYMGVFRPDGNASPRWAGNLKEYKIGFDSTGSGSVVDVNGNAIENASTGFVSPTATSYWTSCTTRGTSSAGSSGNIDFWNTSYYPDSIGTANTNDPNNNTAFTNCRATGAAYAGEDSPDGEMVEKGAVAQKLRDAYSYYGGSARLSGRNLYTCLGTNCASGGLLSTMPFSTSNTNLTSSTLGLGLTGTLSSAVRNNSSCVGATCTSRVDVTLSPAMSNAFAAGNITLSGTTIYDGTKVALASPAPTTTGFSFNVTETPSASATGGSATVSSSSTSLASVSYSDVGATRTVTLTASAAHGFVGSPTILISGISPSASYSGNKAVTVVDATHLSFTQALTSSSTTTAESPPTSASYSATYPTAQFYSSSLSGGSCTGSAVGSPVNLGSVSRTTLLTATTFSTTGASVKTPNSTYGCVTISGTTGYNGSYSCSSADPTSSPGCTKNKASFTVTYGGTITPAITQTTISPAVPTLDSGASVASSGLNYTITSITRTASDCSGASCSAVATVTTSATHALTAGTSVHISGASDSAYDGIYTVLASPAITGTTFAVSLTTSPIKTVSAGSASTNSSGIDSNDMINWIRGQNTLSQDNPSGRSDDVRGYLHGDVLHSKPAVINYNRSGYAAGEDIVVYYGANDGILHAIKGGQTSSDGTELWGFLAPEHFSGYQRLYQNGPTVSLTNHKPTFFDGPISSLTTAVDNVIAGTGAEAYIYAAMRRGGRSLYAFNVLDPSAPKFQWKISGGLGDNFNEVGQTWSEAKLGKIKINGTATDVVFFGGGYDATANDATPQGTATMGRGIFVANARTGAWVWSTGPTVPIGGTTASTMTCSIPGDVSIVDADGDGLIDRIYAGDTCGNLWRVDITIVSNTSTWSVTRIARLGGNGTTSRKFLFGPSVVLETDHDVVLLGSGDREHPFDSTSTTDSFYSLNVPQSLSASYQTVLDLGSGSTDRGNGLCDVTSSSPTTCNCPKGWVFDYSCGGEKTVTSSVVLSGNVFFSTNLPEGVNCTAKGINTTQSCTAGLGHAFDYQVSYQSCGAPSGSYAHNGNRYEERAGGGFPPSPVPLVTTVNGQTVIGVLSGPHFEPVTVANLNRRYRIYWHSNLDKTQ